MTPCPTTGILVCTITQTSAEVCLHLRREPLPEISNHLSRARLFRSNPVFGRVASATSRASGTPARPGCIQSP